MTKNKNNNQKIFLKEIKNMRTTKISKYNTTKTATTFPESKPISNTSSQTPIEIALKIDENGMTSLKNLYEFLEINPSNYSKWCKRNIINNPFATENIDYIPIRLENKNHTGDRPTTDYKLTSDFAKQLSMTIKMNVVKKYSNIS